MNQGSNKKQLSLTQILMGMGVCLFLMGVLGLLSQSGDWAIKASFGLMVVGIPLSLFGLLAQMSKAVGPFQGKATSLNMNMIIQSCLVLAILVFAYRVVVSRPQQWDLTQTGRFTLQQESRDLVEALGMPVKAIMLIEGALDEDTNNAHRQFLEVVKRFEVVFPDRFSHEVIDVWQNPNALNTYRDIYRTPAFFVEAGEDTNLLREQARGPSEQDIGNALNALLHTEQQTIYFLMGHGQLDPNDRNIRGGNVLKTHLLNNHYQVRNLTFTRAPMVPDDCTILVVAGAQVDLSTAECVAIESFVLSGGRLFVALDPFTDTPNLDEMVSKFGVTPRRDLVMEGTLTAPSLEAAMLGSFEFGYSAEDLVGMEWNQAIEITRNFDYKVPFPFSRSLDVGFGARTGLAVHAIVDSGGGRVQGMPDSPISYGETDLERYHQSGARACQFDPEFDVEGPMTLAAAADIDLHLFPGAVVSATDTEQAQSRVVVFGSFTTLNNRIMGDGKTPFVKDFVLRCFAWLGQQGAITIKSHDIMDTRIVPTAIQARLISVISLVIMPLLCVLSGLSMALSRSQYS